MRARAWRSSAQLSGDEKSRPLPTLITAKHRAVESDRRVQLITRAAA